MSSAAPRPRALIFSFGGIVDAAGGDADGGRGAPPCGAGPALSHAGGGVKTMVKTIYFLKNNSKIQGCSVNSRSTPARLDLLLESGWSFAQSVAYRCERLFTVISEKSTCLG